jgi:hypothetical protein
MLTMITNARPLMRRSPPTHIRGGELRDQTLAAPLV